MVVALSNKLVLINVNYQLLSSLCNKYNILIIRVIVYACTRKTQICKQLLPTCNLSIQQATVVNLQTPALINPSMNQHIIQYINYTVDKLIIYYIRCGALEIGRLNSYRLLTYC